MKKPSSSRDKYLALATKLRHRIEFAETILSLNVPASQKVETICLQGRRAVETIAYMCLVATEHGLGHLGIPRDAKKHWNAQHIFTSLKAKRIMTLPSPSRMEKSDDPRFKAIFAGVPEQRLTHDDLIEIYQTFHKGLHEPNPYVQPDESSFYATLLPHLSTNIDRIKRFVWVHFISIKGEGFAVDLHNTHGCTAVVPLSKTAEIPEDLR